MASLMGDEPVMSNSVRTALEAVVFILFIAGACAGVVLLSLGWG